MKRPVLLDHDGALEDLVSLTLLSSDPNVDLLGVCVTPGDGLLEPSVSSSRRLLGLTGRPEVPVGAGALEGRNPFPLAWRTDSVRANHQPALNVPGAPIAPESELPAHQLMAETILASPQPVTVLMIGPLTHLAWCLEHRPEVESKISELVFMGGALKMDGNVDEPGRDGSAEWNVYWDPAAAARVWQSSLPITLFSLDVCNQVPVTKELVLALAAQAPQSHLSTIAGTLWAMALGLEELTGQGYMCWDTLTTSYLTRPDLFTFEDVPCEVITTGPSEGRTVPSAGARPVKTPTSVDVEGFYAHCLEALRRQPDRPSP